MFVSDMSVVFSGFLHVSGPDGLASAGTVGEIFWQWRSSPEKGERARKKLAGFSDDCPNVCASLMTGIYIFKKDILQ